MHISLNFLSVLKYGMFHYKMLNLTVYAQVSFAKYKRTALGRSWIHKKDLKSYQCPVRTSYVPETNREEKSVQVINKI